MPNEFDDLQTNSQTPPAVSRIGTSSRKWDEIHSASGQFTNIVIGNKISVSGVKFDTTADNSTHEPGLVFWDDSEKALAYYTDEPDVKMQIGHELWIFVRNKSGDTIINGKAVIITGAQGNRPTIDLARADSDESIEHLVGIATHDIEHNSDGYVTVNGVLNDLDTTGPSGETWVDGDELYLSATTSGGLTSSRPEAPNYVVHMAHVLNAHANQGKLLVAVSPTNFADPVTFKHIDVLGGIHVYSDINVDTDDTRSLGAPGSGFTDIHATSGHFASGVILTAPNGSGWRMSIDNDGNFVSNGPLIL